MTGADNSAHGASSAPTADAILAQIANLRSREPRYGASEAARRSYRSAAAVLAAINDVAALRPFDRAPEDEDPREILADDLVPVVGSSLSGSVSLKHDLRRAALRALGTRERMRLALQANSHERRGIVQQQFERYIVGNATPFSNQSTEELEATLQVVTWLERIVDGVPDLDAVRRELAQRHFMDRFETLAGDAVFRGRVREMDELRSYVGVLTPQRLLAQLRRKFQWSRPEALPALSISGPGGVGKSALISRLALEHSRLPSAVRIPFAYLDLDRPTLDVAEPLTLLDEMLSQLVMQFAEYPEFKNLHEFLQERLKKESQGATPGRESDDSGQISRASSLLADVLGVMEGKLGPRPYLVILDTFEQVQYRGETLALPFWDLLVRMQEWKPFLRVVISGRAPVTTLRLKGEPPKSLELGDLDRDSAIAFVQTQGIKSPDLAAAIVRQVGGVPLSLKLATALIRREPSAELNVRSRFWLRAADEVVQGLLYDRLLGQIGNPEVMRVAHPGLVLRRITPETILHVLAEPCGLAVRNLEDARQLFEELRKEVSLVSVDDLEGALVHRRDLRAVMLKLMLEKKPAVAEEISRRAIAWYASQTGRRARAEEAYHRLLLGEILSADAFADPEVRASLQASIAELPAKSQRLLATYGFRVDPDVLKKASQEERDASLAAQVEELLPHPSGVTTATGLLEKRGKPRGDSPLWRAWARVMLEQRVDDEARRCLEDGTCAAREAGNLSRLVPLLADRAWACELARGTDGLDDALSTLFNYADRHADFVALAQYGMQSMRYRSFDRSLLDAGEGRKLEKWLAMFRPRDLFGLFPATKGFWSATAHVRPELTNRLALLVADPDSPFGTTSFEDEKVLKDLENLVRLAYSAPPYEEVGYWLERYEFANAAEALVDAWPFRNLHVHPPESHRSFMTA